MKLQNVLYVPSLSTSLFSIKEHAQYEQCSLRVENNRFFLSFPTYTIKKLISDELSITVKLCHRKPPHIHFDSSTAQLSKQSSHQSHDSLFNTLTAKRIYYRPHDHTKLLENTSPGHSHTTNVPETDCHPSSSLPTQTLPIVEDVECDNQPSSSKSNPNSFSPIEMFPDPNDNELDNNGMNISTFPPPYLSSNPRVHIKLPDANTFQNGFLHKSSSTSLWNFYPGNTRKTSPMLLTTELLSSLFSAGLFRRGFLSTPQSFSSSDIPPWATNDKI